MALDGIFISFQAKELSDILTGIKIEKVYQPSRDEIVFSVRKAGFNGKLLISANPSMPRIHFTESTPENPAVPPMFCMLMRKHISSGRISSVYNENFERLIVIEIDTFDELGCASKKYLCIELISRQANIILLDADKRIIDAIRRVDNIEKRQVLSGLFYRLPPSQDKKNIFETEDIFKNYDATESLDKFLLNNYLGISPLVSRELSFRLTGAQDYTLPLDNMKDYTAELKAILKNPQVNLIYKDGELFDFSYIAIEQYQGAENIICESYSQCLQNFYDDKDKALRKKSKSSEITKTISNMLSRAEKKLKIQLKELEDTKSRDKYKVLADIIIANIYNLEKGMKKATVINYFDENLCEVEITLDEKLSPKQNAEKNFKKYNKLKTAEKVLTEQIEISKTNATYLESILFSIEHAENSNDLDAIKQEILKKPSKKPIKSKPYEYKTSDGYTILVGRNNIENDMLTLKLAYKSDIWFHTQLIHGAHVILRTEGAEEITDLAYTQCAKIAAYHSRGKNSAMVPVDYTRVKNIKKPSGAKPGMVIYSVYNTAYVTPDEKEVLSLRVK